jgi:myo-inositol-1(or 4)-monophosphatase
VRDYRELADAARSAAEQAAAQVRAAKRPRAGAAWEHKGALDFVTDVDRASERLIVETLTVAVPGSHVMGEELTPGTAAPAAPAATAGGGGGGGSGVLWIVDPLDGTTNYLHGYPQYAVSIAAVADHTLVAGVVVDVERGLVYHATAGGGAWCGRERLRVSEVTQPSLSLIGTGFPFRVPRLLPGYLRQFTAITHAVSGVRRAGSAALDLADVARGRFEGFWELELAPWDMAAGILLIREAGGVVTDFAGSPDVVRQGPLVAGNPAMHAWLLELLASL